MEEIVLKAIFFLAAAVFTLSSVPLPAQMGASANTKQSTSISAGKAHISGATSGRGNSTVAQGQSAAGASGSLAAEAARIRGVLLRDGAGGSASVVLSASHRKPHLDSGTQLALGSAGR